MIGLHSPLHEVDREAATYFIVKLNADSLAHMGAEGPDLGIPDSLFHSSVVSQTSNQLGSPVKSHLHNHVTGLAL